MAEYPTKSEIMARLKVQMKGARRDTTVKQMRLALQEHFGKNLSNSKDLIRECIEEIMEKDQAEQDGKNSHSDSSDEKSEGEENVHPKPPKRKRAKQSGNGSKPGKGGGPLVQLDEPLADVCGTDKLQRFTIVKKVWEYIREHDLQNPSDKREILCDEKLQRIMGGNKKVTMFSMNKHFKDHILK